MNIINSTSITSTSGVTLISDNAARRRRLERRPDRRPPAEKASVAESAIAQAFSASRRWMAVTRSSAKPSRRAANLPASVENLL